MKVFTRTRNINDQFAGKVPYNRNIAIAMEGFHEMGFEIYFYEKVSDIYDLIEIGDIVLDGIKQVDFCLSKFNLEFPSIDYPEILMPYLGRKIWKDTIDSINANPEKWGNFVKPVKEKVFTGHIINEPKDLIGCGNYSENYEVLVSEPLDIVYEVRGLVYYDELIDLRPYHGSWEYMNKLDINLIKSAMSDWTKWDERPNGCTIDFGVIRKNNKYETVLIEVNAGVSFGPYSTNAINYAKIISAAMSQIYGIPDECHF